MPEVDPEPPEAGLPPPPDPPPPTEGDDVSRLTLIDIFASISSTALRDRRTAFEGVWLPGGVAAAAEPSG